MQTVTADFLSAIVANEREIKVKAEITLLDNVIIGGTPSYSASSTLDAILTPASHAFDAVLAPQKKFAVVGMYPADDIYPVNGDGSSEVGWWSNTQANSSAVFGTAETLAIDYGATQTIGGVSVLGDSWLGGYPVDFDVHYSNVGSPGASDWTLITSVTGNAQTNWAYTLPASVSARHLRLFITKISTPSARAKVIEFLGGFTIDVTDRIKSFTLTKERNAADESTTLPIGNSSANELELVLDNTDGYFYQRNNNSPYYGYLKRDRKVKLWIGVVLPNGSIEYLPQGVFYTAGWSASRGSPEVRVTSRDKAKKMMEQDYTTSIVYENKTISQLAVIVAQAFGLTAGEYSVDATTEVIPYAYFTKAKYWTHLDKLAAGETGAVYFDENEDLIFENRSHMFSTRLTYGTLPGATTINVASVYGLSAGNTLYITDHQHSESITIHAGWDGSSLTLPLTAPLTYEYMGSAFVHKKAVVATLRDSDVLMDMDDQFVLDKAKNKIEVKATPLVVPLDGLGQPVIETIWQLDEGVTVPAGSYETLDVFFSKEPVIKNATYNITITITTETPGDEAFITASWQPSVPYAWGGHLRLTNAKGSAVVVIGCVLSGVPLDTLGGLTAKAEDDTLIAQEGERTYSVESPYIQRRAHAQAIANMLLATWSDPLAPVSAKGIGLPHLQLGDRIKLIDTELGLIDNNLNNHFHLTRIVLDYDGGLDGTYDAIAYSSPSAYTAPTNPLLIGTGTIGQNIA